jgi:ribosome biogenesis SPOUT family RNA methylase Rps3
MTEEEYIDAAVCRVPVVCNGVRYARITAIRFDAEKGVQIEMAENTGNGRVVAPPGIVEAADKEMFEAARRFRRK